MKHANPSRIYWFVVLFLCLPLIKAKAQDSGWNTPTNNFQSPTNKYLSQQFGPTTPGSGGFGASYMGTSALAGSAAAVTPFVPTGPPLTRWGPVEVYPHFRYAVTYGNGLLALPGMNTTTFVNTVAPGVLLKLGEHWTLDCTPSLTFYSNPLFHNTTDQDVKLSGFRIYDNWTLSLTQSYIDTTQPLVDAGRQIEQEAYATAFNAERQLGAKTSLQLALNQNFRLLSEPGLSSLHEWSTADWFNYQFDQRFGVALGITGGYDEVSEGSDMPFEQGMGRVVFHPSAKLSLTVIGGMEDRQFIHPSEAPLVGPVFQVLGLYQILDGTSLTLAANRTVIPSLEANEVNTITSVSLSGRQTIVGKMFFELTGNYVLTPYEAIAPAPLPAYYFGAPTRTALVTTRDDTRTSVQARLSTVIGTRLTASIFYMYNDNQSSQANFSFQGNQVGLEMIYRY